MRLWNQPSAGSLARGGHVSLWNPECPAVVLADVVLMGRRLPASEPALHWADAHTLVRIFVSGAAGLNICQNLAALG